MAGKAAVYAKTPEPKQKSSGLCKQESGINNSGFSADRILHLQRTAGNQAVQRLIRSGVLQAKLKIGQPNDIYEQEADRVADMVMRMPEPQAVPRDTLSFQGIPPKYKEKELRRHPIEEEEEKGDLLQTKEISEYNAEITPDLESRINAIGGGGQPLAESERTFFELWFGEDFNQVRVHTDSQAAETAKSINAKAFTVGHNIAFGGGQYAPESYEGRQLLAHELTHVVQQNSEQLQRTHMQENVTVQRDSPPGSLSTNPFSSSSDPFGLLVPKKDQLRFTNRSFPKLSLPNECPRCHDRKPIGPQLPQFIDRDATEPRLVEWGKESDLMLHHSSSIRILQLDPKATDALVDDYGVGLTKRITLSHEFEGSDAARTKGSNTIRNHWNEIRPAVRERLSIWYRDQLVEAVAMTPKWASPLLDPVALRTSLSSHYGERAPLGRLGAEAAPGQKYGVFEIDDIGLGQIWFHLPGRPLWRYQISRGDFIRHDPLVAAVAEQVYDNTKWILQVTPLIMKMGAFAMGFSGNIAVIIAGIVLDELATEMQADTEGRASRSVEEILGSGATQLIVDRIFHGLLGGGAGRTVAGMGKSAAKIEKIAEKAVPAIRRELVQVEKPLVKQALESGTARQVTDKTMKAEGHIIEVVVETVGESHIFRLNRKGTWCRFSSPICDLDLGADIATAARSPSSSTMAKLQETKALSSTIMEEISFLGKMYERMRAIGKVDMALLSKEERALLDTLVPSGDAAKISLRELRDLPVKLGLKRDVIATLGEETKLIQQLYREGQPLHKIMREASPSSAARSRVLREAYGRDTVTGTAARSGSLHVDHVVPLNDIVRMKGFDKLRPERQLEIVNDLKNLRATDALANTSRGHRSWWSWAQAQIYYDPAQIAKMRALEDELRVYLEGRIRTLSRP